MAIRKTRNADSERLDDATMLRAIEYLEGEKPGTKKGACEILNISYNTSRLDKLIETFKTKKEHEAKRKAEKRGKPATTEEISYIVTEYLEGAPIDAISKGIYRGPQFVKGVLEKQGVPERQTSTDYFKPNLIPDAASRESFSIGERVFSARYNTTAIIRAEIPCKSGKAYRIWLEGESQEQFAYQPVWELASLQHLRDQGINL